MIISSAILFSSGEILDGPFKSYGYLGALANKLSFHGDRIYGFMNSKSEFVSPEEAAQIAYDEGQINVKLDSLSPEDLWPQLEEEHAY